LIFGIVYLEGAFLPDFIGLFLPDYRFINQIWILWVDAKIKLCNYWKKNFFWHWFGILDKKIPAKL